MEAKSCSDFHELNDELSSLLSSFVGQSWSDVDKALSFVVFTRFALSDATKESFPVWFRKLVKRKLRHRCRFSVGSELLSSHWLRDVWRVPVRPSSSTVVVRDNNRRKCVQSFNDLRRCRLQRYGRVRKVTRVKMEQEEEEVVEDFAQECHSSSSCQSRCQSSPLSSPSCLSSQSSESSLSSPVQLSSSLSSLSSSLSPSSSEVVSSVQFVKSMDEVVFVNSVGVGNRQASKVGSLVSFLIDSGAQIHCIPRKFGGNFVVQGRRLKVRGAGGTKIPHYGQRPLVLSASSKSSSSSSSSSRSSSSLVTLSVCPEVCDVTEPILSSKLLAVAGWRTSLDDHHPHLRHLSSGVVVPLVSRNNGWYLSCRLTEVLTSSSSDMDVDNVAVNSIDDPAAVEVDGPSSSSSSSSSSFPVVVPVPSQGVDLDESVEAGASKAKPLRAAGTPSPTAVAQHELTHLPFMPWCSVCVAGKCHGK